MNKGLFWHIVLTILYFLSVMYIFQDAPTTIENRVLIICIFGVLQLFTTIALCLYSIEQETSIYNQKIFK